MIGDSTLGETVFADERTVCSSCKTINTIRYPRYIEEEQFIEYCKSNQRGVDLDSFRCRACSVNNDFGCNLTVYSNKRNVTIFVVFGGDNESIESEFEQEVASMQEFLSDVAFKRLRTRPYVFVDGWRGLYAILNLFSGRAEFAELVDVSSKVEMPEQNYVDTICGYKYGDLFFYWTSEHNLRGPIRAFLGDARIYVFNDNLQQAYELLKTAVSVLGETSIDIASQLGVLCFRLEHREEAKYWLEKAINMEHRRLSPTINYIDATPRKRASGETQRSDLPHTLPATMLSNVLNVKHVVEQVMPPMNDFGLWYFPRLDLATLPNGANSLKKVVKLTGITLGILEYLRTKYSSYTAYTKDSIGFVMLKKHLTDFHNGSLHLGTHDDLFDADFWRAYTTSRWNIPTNMGELAKSADPDLRQETARLLGRIVGEVTLLIQSAKEGGRLTIERYLLENTGSVLLNMTKEFIRLCPVDERRQLARIEVQEEVDTISASDGIKWTVKSVGEDRI